MSKCDWCDNEATWLKSMDSDMYDTIYRRFYGMPGPNSKPLRACDEHRLHLDYSVHPDEGLGNSLIREALGGQP